MIAAKEAENPPFSDADIIANVFILLLAGEDTTAHMPAWAIRFLIQYPAMRERVRAEVDSGLGAAQLPERFEDAGRLPLVDALANETMRQRPVAPILVFEAKFDSAVAGVSVPAGTNLVLLARRIADSAENFSQPDEFVIDRWLEKGASEGYQHNPKAFMPCGGGARFCPGRNLALLEVNVVLAMLLRNFDVELADDGQPIGELFALTISPTHLQVRFRQRA
jgi:cytochrome P450